MKRLENLTNDSFLKSLELNLKENSKYFFLFAKLARR